jgi:hypothetical protein
VILQTENGLRTRRLLQLTYWTVVTKLDGDAGVNCAEGATATAEKIALPFASRPMVRA